jgi:hypothetical protein
MIGIPDERCWRCDSFLWQEDLVSVAWFVTDCVSFLRTADSPSNQPWVAGRVVVSLMCSPTEE